MYLTLPPPTRPGEPSQGREKTLLLSALSPVGRAVSSMSHSDVHFFPSLCFFFDCIIGKRKGDRGLQRGILVCMSYPWQWVRCLEPLKLVRDVAANSRARRTVVRLRTYLSYLITVTTRCKRQFFSQKENGSRGWNQKPPREGWLETDYWKSAGFELSLLFPSVSSPPLRHAPDTIGF